MSGLLTEMAQSSLARLEHARARESEQARVEAWFPEKSAFFRNALALGLKTEPSPVALCLMLYRKDLSLEWFAEHWHYTIGDSDLF